MTDFSQAEPPVTYWGQFLADLTERADDSWEVKVTNVNGGEARTYACRNKENALDNLRLAFKCFLWEPSTTSPEVLA